MIVSFRWLCFGVGLNMVLLVGVFFVLIVLWFVVVMFVGLVLDIGLVGYLNMLWKDGCVVVFSVCVGGFGSIGVVLGVVLVIILFLFMVGLLLVIGVSVNIGLWCRLLVSGVLFSVVMCMLLFLLVRCCCVVSLFM